MNLTTREDIECSELEIRYDGRNKKCEVWRRIRPHYIDCRIFPEPLILLGVSGDIALYTVTHIMQNSDRRNWPGSEMERWLRRG